MVKVNEALRVIQPGQQPIGVGKDKRVAGLGMRNGTSKSPLRPRPRDELLEARGTVLRPPRRGTTRRAMAPTMT